MVSTMQQRAYAFGERLLELDKLNTQLSNLRSERSRYVTGVYKIATSEHDDRLIVILSGIDRETQELVELVLQLGGDPV